MDRYDNLSTKLRHASRKRTGLESFLNSIHRDKEVRVSAPLSENLFRLEAGNNTSRIFRYNGRNVKRLAVAWPD